jgi:CheY-like chemotaxis protein
MGDGKFILLVEDNRDDELLMLRALQRNCIPNQVVVVRDGVEALDFLFATGAHAGRDPDEMPQVVLLDLKLPRVDGLEVLRRVRADQRTRLLPVVVLTSSKEEEDVARSYTLGANSYVRKPVDFTQFTDAIRTLGLFWLLVNEFPPASSRR